MQHRLSFGEGESPPASCRSVYDWSFLAMTHQQLGHENDVRRWYNVAVEHTKKEDANDQQPALYRAEAANLLDASVASLRLLNPNGR